MELELISSISRFRPTRKTPDGGRVIDAAQRAERAGLDSVLIGYGSSSSDGWQVADFVSAATTRLRMLLAHRPGVMMPTAAARMASTLDVFSNGRLSLNIVTGGSAVDTARDGDFEDHDTRYRRSIEYVDVMKKCWTATEPFDHEGEFYKFVGNFQDVQPVQRPYPRLYMAGASEMAKQMAIHSTDVYMAWAEPLVDMKARFDEVRELRRNAGVPDPGFSISARLIIGESETEAWRLADSLVSADDFKELSTSTSDRIVDHSLDQSAYKEDWGRNRQLQLVQDGMVHDERLWMGLVAKNGGHGASAALVGTTESLLEALLKYVEVGSTCLLLTGTDGEYVDLPDGFLRELREEANKIIAKAEQPA